MSQQTHQIQQSWNKNNRKQLGPGNRRRQGQVMYSKNKTGLMTNDVIDQHITA